MSWNLSKLENEKSNTKTQTHIYKTGLLILFKSFPDKLIFTKFSLSADTRLHVIAQPSIENPIEADRGSCTVLNIIIKANRIEEVKVSEIGVVNIVNFNLCERKKYYNFEKKISRSTI